MATSERWCGSQPSGPARRPSTPCCSSRLTVSGAPPALANIASYSCGIALAYVLNRRWTFRSEGGLARAARFYLLMFAGLLLSTLIVTALSMILPPFVAKLISVPIVFAYNYTASRRWVFGRGPIENP